MLIKLMFSLIVAIGFIVTCLASKIALRAKASNNVASFMKKIYHKEKIEEEYLDFCKSKIKKFGMIFGLFGVVGLIYIFAKDYENTQITKVSKPNYGDGNAKIELMLNNGSSNQRISVSVPEQDMSEAYKIDMCDKAIDKVIGVICADNKGKDYINSDMYFPFEIDSDIQFEYIIDSNYVDENGKIDKENIPFENGKYSFYVTITATYKDASKDRKVQFTVIEDEFSYEKYVQDYIDNSKEDTIVLPQQIGKENVSYKKVTEDYSVLILIGLIITIVAFFYSIKNEMKDALKKRQDQLREDYYEIVSIISLLQSTGQSMRTSWSKVIDLYDRIDKKRFVCEEMRIARNKMDRGIPELQAYREFGERCDVMEYTKFSNIIEQNVVRGTKDLRAQLEKEVINAKNERIAISREKAEKCSTKLLFPMMIMLVIVMIILIVPAFISMDF